MTDLPDHTYGLRCGAEEFPLMIIVSMIYPCNFGCPMCPYTDGNSEIRAFYRDNDAELFPVDLWTSMADEAGEYGAWLRCTGGGEPMLHPRMVDMVEYAKGRGARVWMNTNGSMFGPNDKQRQRLRRLIAAGIDLIEFSMDAADAELYARLRPPRGGAPRDPEKWFNGHVDNIRAAVRYREELVAPTRIVVSIIRQDAIEGKIEKATDFYLKEIGVDEVITRKFLTWDDNTSIDQGHALDKHLYAALPVEKKEPCVWPFERMNVDTLGRVSLCGQDISFRTSKLFPNAKEVSVKDIWRGEMFDWYRRMHLDGRGSECWPCRGCSAWLAGVRDWDYGWLRVLQSSGAHLKEMMRRDLGVEIEIFEPEY